MGFQKSNWIQPSELEACRELPPRAAVGLKRCSWLWCHHLYRSWPCGGEATTNTLSVRSARIAQRECSFRINGSHCRRKAKLPTESRNRTAAERASVGTEPPPRAAVGGRLFPERSQGTTSGVCYLWSERRPRGQRGADSAFLHPEPTQPSFTRCLNAIGDRALKVNLLINGYFK